MGKQGVPSRGTRHTASLQPFGLLRDLQPVTSSHLSQGSFFIRLVFFLHAITSVFRAIDRR